MKKYLFFMAFIACIFTAAAQNNMPDSGSFFLHKVAQNIGKETYKLTKEGNNLRYDISFKFVDRGSPVPLKAQLIVTKDMEPVSLFIKGNTSRFSTINDTINIVNKKVSIKLDDSTYNGIVKPLTFPVGGYSPGTVQMALLQYWNRHKQPKSISLLPTGEVSITRAGSDTVSFNGKQLLLERYVLSGLIWGNEIIWTDNNLDLICLITNDAEGDKLEMMKEEYESLLPELISRAAKYGMELFNASMKMDNTSNSVAIVGGNVVNVEDGTIIKEAVIIIENGIIKKIGKKGEVAFSSNMRIISADGKTILPGLWDMHAHFEQAEWGPAYLAAGVTTVRDCGNEFGYINSIKAAIDAHKGIGPNILKAGIVDGPGAMALGVIRATTPEEAVSVVQMYKNNGFAQIKIYSSVQPAIVKAICVEAHRLGLTVTGHIPNGMNIEQGVDSGMDQVNHIQYVYSAMKKNKDKSVDLSDSSNIAVLDFLKQHHTVIDPTIGVFEMIMRSVKEDITIMEPAYYSLPVPLQALFTNMGMPEAQAKVYKPRFDAMKNLVKALFDKGIPVVAGTDMGFPGYSLDRELELYVESGLTPLQAIQTATIIPAQVMNIDKQTGSIKEGKQADLIIVDADPLQNIRNIRKVSVVIKGGQQYDPVTLHKMVGFKN